jgi:hypothetical protein
MATRFDIEVCRHFHAGTFRSAWLERGKQLSRELALDGADALSRVIEHVKTRSASQDDALVAELSDGLRETERRIEARCQALARELMDVVAVCRSPI